VTRIGKGIYAVGSTGVVEAEDAGFIEFMVNDDRLDNAGHFTVKVILRVTMGDSVHSNYGWRGNRTSTGSIDQRNATTAPFSRAKATSCAEKFLSTSFYQTEEHQIGYF